MTAPDGHPADGYVAGPCQAGSLGSRRGLKRRLTLVECPSAAVRPAAQAPAAEGPQETDVTAETVYEVSCTAGFRAAVLRLAQARGATPEDIARSVLLLVAPTLTVADPGVPEEGAECLRLRLPPGFHDSTLRRLLATALALADPDGWRIAPGTELARLDARVETLEYRNKALVNALERLSFQPLQGGLTQLRDAVRLFGFVNEWCFDEDRVNRRFRELAPVYHPDTGVVGCRERMGQLIEARNMLIRHVRTAYTSGDWVRRRHSGNRPAD
jgi:hypothetical protein